MESMRLEWYCLRQTDGRYDVIAEGKLCDSIDAITLESTQLAGYRLSQLHKHISQNQHHSGAGNTSEHRGVTSALFPILFPARR